jgi:hypothetical protein
VSFRVVPAPTPEAGTLGAYVESGGRRYAEQLERIDELHIPLQTVFLPAEAHIVHADIARIGDAVGYVMGSGDQVPEALRQVGYKVTLLADEDLESTDLSRFGSIVLGVRAFNTRPRLRALQGRLMEYVRAGGTVVAQYNTAEDALNGTIGPYPFTLSHDRVTDEEAAVRPVSADQPLLQRPNRITDADFAGWVQERGLYFANPWDPRYQTVLACHDPGEPAREGGLLVARYGKGVFIYTGYAWFRQLPAGVPGAYKLFVNLVSARGR